MPSEALHGGFQAAKLTSGIQLQNVLLFYRRFVRNWPPGIFAKGDAVVSRLKWAAYVKMRGSCRNSASSSHFRFEIQAASRPPGFSAGHFSFSGVFPGLGSPEFRSLLRFRVCPAPDFRSVPVRSEHLNPRKPRPKKNLQKPRPLKHPLPKNPSTASRCRLKA